MTRGFSQRTVCPDCGASVTLETPFDRWIRNCSELDSSPFKAALAIFDCDLLIHKYVTPTDKLGTRKLQAMMFVEVKSHGSVLTPSQRDTLYIFNQILRNRKRTPTKPKIPQQAETLPNAVYSPYNDEIITLRGFGGHWLQMSNNDPVDSEILKWDKKRITYEMLIGILRFDLDPDSLKKLEWRRHHKQDPTPTLFDKTA